jgi:hypothetical protein
MERDASRAHAATGKQDVFSQARVSSSRSKQLIDLVRILEERKMLLCMQEMDLEVRKAILVKEQECGL